MNEVKKNIVLGLVIGLAFLAVIILFVIASKNNQPEFASKIFVFAITFAIILVPFAFLYGFKKEEKLVKEWKRKNPGKEVILHHRVLFFDGENYSEKYYGIAIFTTEQFSFVKEKQPEKVFYYNEMSEKKFENINLSAWEAGGKPQVLPLISFNYPGKKYGFSLGFYKLKKHQKIAKELFRISTSENYADES